MNRISSIRPMTMRTGEEMSQAYREEFERRRKRALIADKPIALSTHYPSEFEESSEDVKFTPIPCPVVRGIASQHKRDSGWFRFLLKTALILAVTLVAMALIAYVANQIQK